VKPPALTLPADDKPDPDLAGAAIHNDLERIVGFSLENQKSGDQAWGRITGFSGAANALQWATTKFREAGLKNVELQEYEGASPGMWQPDRWEARVLPDPSFGEGLESVVLGSAMPTSGSQISGGTLTAPLVDTGAIDTPLPQTLNVTGKVAVQYVSAASAYAARSNVSTRARDLGKRGAVAVINAFNQTGNMYVRDFGNCGVPCFNVGGQDGAFLRDLTAAAEKRNAAVKVQLSLSAAVHTGLKGHNAIATDSTSATRSDPMCPAILADTNRSASRGFRRFTRGRCITPAGTRSIRSPSPGSSGRHGFTRTSSAKRPKHRARRSTHEQRISLTSSISPSLMRCTSKHCTAILDASLANCEVNRRSNRESRHHW
jgi:hypothetical protein